MSLETPVKLPLLAFPYTAVHLFAITAGTIYLHLHRNSLWVDFSLIGYPALMLSNGLLTIVLKEMRNNFYKATKLAFKLMLLCFLPFLFFVLF